MLRLHHLLRFPSFRILIKWPCLARILMVLRKISTRNHPDSLAPAFTQMSPIIHLKPAHVTIAGPRYRYLTSSQSFRRHRSTDNPLLYWLLSTCTQSTSYVHEALSTTHSLPCCLITLPKVHLLNDTSSTPTSPPPPTSCPHPTPATLLLSFFLLSFKLAFRDLRHSSHRVSL